MLPRAQLSILPNSLRLITASVPDSELVTAIIAVKTGARSERPGERGVSHFLEHQLFKGSEMFRSPMALNSAMAAIGATYNASTNMEYTYFTVTAPEKHAEEAMQMLADVVLRPRLIEEEFSRERLVVFEELMMSHQDDDSYIEILFEDLMYKHHSLGWDISGTVKSLRGLTRRKVMGYLRRWYAGRRMAVALIGGGDMPRLRRQAAKLFSEAPEGVSRSWKPFWRDKTSRRNRHLMRDEKLTTMLLGVPGVAMGSPLMVPQELLRQVLGGQTSSRLYDRIREKEGLVYDIFADCEYYSDAGHFSIFTQASAGHAPRVIKGILEEFQGLINRKVSGRELKSAKSILIGQLGALAQDQEGLGVFFLKNILIGGRLVQLHEQKGTIARTSLETVQWLAWMLFWKKPWYLASIGRENPLHLKR